MTSTSSLRGRKRARNRRALAEITLTLSRERGLDNVTVAEIAEKAELSRRTFSNYFSCKEEAIADVLIQRAQDGLDTWEAPDESDLIGLVRSLVLHQMQSGLHEIFPQIAELAATSSTLSAYAQTATWRTWQMASDRLGQEIRRSFPPEQARVATDDLPMIMGAISSVVDARGTREDSPAERGSSEDSPAERGSSEDTLDSRESTAARLERVIKVLAAGL